MADDEETLKQLVRGNLHVVVSVARKYQHHGVALSDLMDAGILGLVRAARTYHETKGIKFISYAVWRIYQAILQELTEHGRGFRRGAERSSAMLREIEPLKEQIRRTSHEEDRLLDRLLDRLPDFPPGSFSPVSDGETWAWALDRTVAESLATLKNRDARVLRLYFGLDGQEPRTLEEIGSLLDTKPRRVRRIKDKALLQLGRVSKARFLEKYVEPFMR